MFHIKTKDNKKHIQATVKSSEFGIDNPDGSECKIERLQLSSKGIRVPLCGSLDEDISVTTTNNFISISFKVNGNGNSAPGFKLTLTGKISNYYHNRVCILMYFNFSFSCGMN